MPPRKRQQLVRAEQVKAVEVLPPEASLPTGSPTTAEQLDRYVQLKVAELMARREDAIPQPFFQNRRVYQELKKIMSVPEQRKWAAYFDRFGCLFCKAKKRPHSSCGMCHPCKLRVAQRLNAIVKELSNGGNDEPPDTQ